jgi:hypothetical protein
MPGEVSDAQVDGGDRERVYFVVAAGTFAVLVPWLVTGWQFHRPWSYWVVAQACPPGDPACTPGRPGGPARARSG